MFRHCLAGAVLSTIAAGTASASDVRQNGSLDDERAAIEETFQTWTEALSDATDGADEKAADVAGNAWSDVKSAWQDVEDATADGWEAAKSGFYDAVDRLEAAIE